MPYSVQDDLERQLKTIITAKSPSFIFIRDLSATDVARSTLESALTTLSQEASTESEKPAFAFVNCIACFTPRILFDSILYALVDSSPESRSKRELLASQRNDSLDDFLHNIQLLFPRSTTNSLSAGSDAVKVPSKIVLVFERAEKLKDALSRLIHPLSRLQDLARRNITTIFLSDAGWETLTPVPGTFTDPYIIDVDVLNRQDVIERICETFPKDTSPDSISLYNPSLEPLFDHFVQAVYNVCAPFTTDPTELAYIVSARWPGFVAPVLEDWKQHESGPYHTPTEEARIRLMRLFNPSLMSALESLHPRTMERTEWSVANSFPDGSRLSQSLGAQLPSTTVSPVDSPDSVPKLSVMSMFIVLAGFLASYNPAKTDYRMFGRGADEKSRRRRKGGGTRKTRPGTVAKLPQRLVGPMSFSYDRLIAILGSLLREYEYDDSKQIGETFEDVSDLKVETDVYRVQTSASIRELISLHLLHRSTAQEKLDALSFRCGVGYEQALLLARKLGIPLNDLMWEPN